MLVRAVYAGSSWSLLSICGVRSTLPILVLGAGGIHATFTRGNLCPALRKRKGRARSLHLLFLNGFQLKIICVPKCEVAAAPDAPHHFICLPSCFVAMPRDAWGFCAELPGKFYSFCKESHSAS